MKNVSADELRARIRRTKAEIAQLIQDAESWNENHPEHPPLDPDPGGEMAMCNAMLDRMLKSLPSN